MALEKGIAELVETFIAQGRPSLQAQTLMDQQGLKAADLADELGSRSNVSNILNGRRALTVQHIKALSERFNLPAQAFIA